MSDSNRRLVLAERPQGLVDDSIVHVEEEIVPQPGPGQALARVRFLSIDPTIRTWMDDREGYLPPIAIGEVIRSAGIAEVTESNSDRYAPGDMLFGMTGWQDWVLAGDGTGVVQKLPPGVTPTSALNVFGTTGLTAYFGLIEVGRVKEGDAVVVSGAAGATGSVVGQIARVKGASRVVGIAGSAEKCAWLTDELGFDVTINYKSDDLPAALRDACPKGIDVYFDNVGGDILNVCLGQLAMRGRVVLCGAIASYNDPGPPKGPSNYINLIPKRGRMEGFIILDYLDRMAEAQAEIGAWVAAGQIKSVEHVVDGLQNAPDALNLLFSGGNTGKVIVAV
jgi:NADPH-dependent curcumin reductase CurA